MECQQTYLLSSGVPQVSPQASPQASSEAPPQVSPQVSPQGSFMRSSAALQFRPPQDGPVVFLSPPSGLLSDLLSDLVLGLLPGLLLCILSLYVNILLVCGSRSTEPSTNANS